MRISGPIMAQRLRPAPGWTAYGPRIVVLHAAQMRPEIAAALPPQQRGDAACLTLVMAQALAGTPARSGGYRPISEDEGPIFAISA